MNGHYLRHCSTSNHPLTTYTLHPFDSRGEVRGFPDVGPLDDVIVRQDVCTCVPLHPPLLVMDDDGPVHGTVCASWQVNGGKNSFGNRQQL